MKINRKQLVQCLIALEFPEAKKWPDAQLIDYAGKIPENVDPNNVPKEHVKFYERLAERKESDEIELEDGPKYLDHKLAEVFPLIAGDEFNELVKDIAKNGLLDSIVLFEDKILDGRNRARACVVAKVEPTYRKFNSEKEGSPVSYVISKNVHRRNLTTSQRAAAAAELLPALEAEAKDRKVKAGRESAIKQHQEKTEGKKRVGEKLPQPDKEDENEAKRSASVAAKSMKVSRRMVNKAKNVKEKAPELFDEVKQGKRTLNSAKNEVEKREPAKPNAKKKAFDIDKAWARVERELDVQLKTWPEDQRGEFAKRLKKYASE